MDTHTRYCLRTVGISSLLHFLVDGLCVCCLYLLAESHQLTHIVAAFMTYNVLAFLTQPLTGWYVDRVERKHWVLLASILLLTLAVLAAALMTNIPSWRDSSVCLLVVASLLGMGNSLFHVWGGKQVVLKTDNDIRALGVFVSTGAFGLSVGVVFHSWPLLLGFLLAVSVLALAYMNIDTATDNMSGHVVDHGTTVSFSRLAVWLAMAALVAFVLFRSFVGQSFSSGMGKTSAIILTLGAVSMVGKMAGGWLVKAMGLLRALLFVLLATLSCLVFRTSHPVILMVGLFMINCTMPITLYLANVVMRGREGLAFGLLAAALMPGYLLAFL